MPLPLATLLLQLSAAYLALGTLLLPWLYGRAWTQAAPGARGASWGFAVAALPGTLLLWPILVRRARHPARASGDDPAALRRAQSGLLLVAVLVVLGAVALSLATRPPRATVERLPSVLGAQR